jgi:hypothetical protein
MKKHLMAAIALSVTFCCAQESAVITPIPLPDSYEAERIERLEKAVGFETCDFSYAFPKDSMIEVTFVTYYKGVAAPDATYAYIITPDDESSGSTGRISLFSLWNRDGTWDNWSQWQFCITKSSRGNNGLAAGVPLKTFREQSKTDAPTGNGESTFSSAALDVIGQEAVIWKRGTTSEGEEFWRYEMHVKRLPCDKSLKFKSVVAK